MARWGQCVNLTFWPLTRSQKLLILCYHFRAGGGEGGREIPPAILHFIFKNPGGYPVNFSKWGPHILYLVWLQSQASLGFELRAEGTICYMKTLKADHSTDWILPGLVPGIGFFCGFTLGWGFSQAVWAAISPRKSSWLVRLSSSLTIGHAVLHIRNHKRVFSFLSSPGMICYLQSSGILKRFINMLPLDLWAHWTRHSYSLLPNKSDQSPG